MDMFSIFLNMKVCCVFSLKSPHRGTQYTRTIFNIKKKMAQNYSKSAAMGIFPRVRNSRGKRAISVRATEFLLYIRHWWQLQKVTTETTCNLKKLNTLVRSFILQILLSGSNIFSLMIEHSSAIETSADNISLGAKIAYLAKIGGSEVAPFCYTWFERIFG